MTSIALSAKAAKLRKLCDAADGGVRGRHEIVGDDNR